ncbi:long-chain-fatty-acid--CoA ligase [Alicyclobacillus contaminans]|uniref:long-chain-fatty-acid--CoA ligase n=1 Tax=Alicyclobacillus contaminans TaxID=392016 RepID=UPI000A0076F0
MRIYDMLSESATRRPTQRATIFGNHVLTYEQLLVAVRRAMAGLKALGVQQGDRVGILLPNCPQYVIAYYAITGIGAIVVQMNPLSPPPELEYLFQDSGATAVIALDKTLPGVRSVQSATSLTNVIAVRFGQSEASLAAGEQWFDEWLASSSSEADPASFDPDETIAILQYTGGTTGRPKGAMLTHQNVVANAIQADSMIPHQVTESDMSVCALPLFHVYAMTVAMNVSIYNAIPILLVPRFQPKELAELIQRHRPSFFPAVPTMYLALAQAIPEGSDALSSLTVCNSGGAPMPLQVMQTFEAVSGATVLEGYGLSEASPLTHVNPSAERRKLGSIGLPTPNTEVRIVSLEDPSVTLPVGEEGELAIRGPQVMKGYWKRPKETAETLVDGWLLTGDVAKMDEEGYTYIVDRKKDMIIASGYNVYPREVEEVLYQHPDILEAAVVGVPDSYRGETVKAVVVCKPGRELTAEAVESWCRKHLSAYKVPKLVEFRTELVKSAVGKVLRRSLREQPTR